MPSLADAVALYMSGDEIASLSESSRTRTRVVLNALMDVAGRKLMASRLTRVHVDKTVASWRPKLTENSINAYKITLRGFGTWLFDMRYNRSDVGKHLKHMKTTTDYRKRKPLTKAQVSKVIKAARLFHERDYVSVMILLATGLRESEVVALRWDDIDMDARLIHARRPKVVDTHTVPMSGQLRDVLMDWKAAYTRLCGDIKGSWYVVPSLISQFGYAPSERLSMAPARMQTNLRRRIKKYMAMAGVEDLTGKGSHTMRRTAANLLLDSGADVRDVMHLLGHSSETMTNRYLDRDTGREKLADRMRDWEI